MLEDIKQSVLIIFKVSSFVLILVGSNTNKSCKAISF